MFAATFRAAEFRVSRGFGQILAEGFLCKDSIAASTQIAGSRRGRQRGLIIFLAAAAEFNGAEFDGAMLRRMGWGLYPKASAARHIRALNDMRSFPPSVHLLTREIGA